MAVINKLKKPDPIPQNLYTPKIKNEEKIDLKLYTPKIENKEKIDNTQEVPEPELEEINVPIYIPEPELFPIEIPLYIPEPKNNNVRNFLIIPNLETLEFNQDIYVPEMANDEINQEVYQPELELNEANLSLFTPNKLKTFKIPSYAYAFPIKKGYIETEGFTEDVRDFNMSAFEVNPINSWTINLNFDGAPNEDYRGFDENWINQWKEIEDSYKHTQNREDLFWLQIMPYNIELPKDANGKKKKISYKIPKIRLPKTPIYRGAYIATQNKNPNQWQFWKWTGQVPDPNFKAPKYPASQGWGADDWAARGEEFAEEWENLWSAENWKNIGLEALKDFSISTISSMLTFGGYGKENTSQPLVKHLPHIFWYQFFVNPPKESDSYTWLLSPSSDKTGDPNSKSIFRPEKFNFYAGDKSNHPISMLNAIGPDFMKHKFDAYFIFQDEENNLVSIDFDKEKWMTPFQKFIYNHKGFAVRFGTINIPAISKDSFNINWLETQINKPRTTINIENKATFTLRLDQNLFWLDFLDKIAGHNNTVDQLAFLKQKGSSDAQYSNYFYKEVSEESNHSWKEVINYISQSYFSKINKKLCLVVKMAHLSNFIYTGTQLRLLPYFVFEDIRILGTSTSLSYERESNNIQDLSINFIFKSLREVYWRESGETKFEFTTNTKEVGQNVQLDLINHIFSKENLKENNTWWQYHKGLKQIYTYEDLGA
jgi:type IV secretory pathway TrbF-like protein